MHGLNTLRHLNQEAENRELIQRSRDAGHYVVALRTIAGSLVFFGKYRDRAAAEAAVSAADSQAVILPPYSTTAEVTLTPGTATAA
jgi:hypothetical protein